MQGKYDPAGTEGRKLLANVLGHVIQQTGEIHLKIKVSTPGDKYELEADEVG